MSYDDNRLDKRLADLLHGDHPIEGEHIQKVVEIAELIVLEHATQKAGWHRHTGDWDWGAWITYNGETVGTAWAVEFVLPETVKFEDFTASVDYREVTHIHVEGIRYDDEEDMDGSDLNEDILIDKITNIRWEEM